MESYLDETPAVTFPNITCVAVYAIGKNALLTNWVPQIGQWISTANVHRSDRDLISVIILRGQREVRIFFAPSEHHLIIHTDSTAASFSQRS